MTNEPQLSRTKALSPVWFIPLLALVIAVWLALRAWQASGPIIQVEFEGAAGITVGKTHVRYRDVDVGEVKEIQLSDDFAKVRVLIEMDRHVSRLLTDQTNFWVVSPRISLSGVSGIETLLSGVYIEMDSSSEGEGKAKSEFVGLDEPPSVRSYDIGNSYLLVSDTLGSLDLGSPVYYRQVPVGEVTSYKLLPEQGKVQIRFFIKAPYNELVKEHSQFWNISGFDATVGVDGVNIEVGALNALIAGGVEFDTLPSHEDEAVLAESDHSFYLFEDRDAVSEGAIAVSYPFLLRFFGSVRGLKVGAPVEYLGLPVGKVKRITFENDTEHGRHIKVLIGIQPERIGSSKILPKEKVHEEMAELVRNGMQARLQAGSLISSSLFVDMVPNAAEQGEMLMGGRYPEFPTSDGEYSQITRQLAGIVERIHNIPIEEIGADLQDTLEGLSSVMKGLEQGDVGNKAAALMDNLASTMTQLNKTLRSIDQSIAPDSALSYTLTEALEDISDAAKSVEQLTDELNRYPDSLLRGKESD